MKPGSGLDTPVQYLKGIGPKRAQQLARLGVETVGQLLFLVPHRYLDRSHMRAIRDLRPGDEATVVGRIVAAGARRLRNYRQVVSAMVRDAQGGMIEVVWFNRPDLKERFKPNQEVLISGQVSRYRDKQFVNPMFELMEDGEFSLENTISPIYPLTEGLSTWTLRRAERAALDKYLSLVPETLTREMREHYGFPEVQTALEAIHFPRDVASALRGRERLAYDELFYFELLLALRRIENAQVRKGAALVETGLLTSRFRGMIPFKFTHAQDKVLDEIRKDMAGPHCMNRLLQGDVGSGKTVVALYAMLVAAECGGQSAMMAPTEILAEQHFRGWAKTLEALGVRAALLTGSTRAAARKEILEGLRTGDVQMVFGTHALIEGEVTFGRLALVVVDEQHRFGVMQRAALLGKGASPDFLVMTATPIPRTLTMSLYGDLDVSILDEKPPGRKPIATRLVTDSQRQATYASVAKHLDAGEQAFVVCPLIEESEKLDLASAIQTHRDMEQAFPKHRVGLVHGKMKADERNGLMDRFRSRELDILVATSVIEVGVDIPNATMMLIEHPERFGLAQLHQLRGRIGRGERQSFCILLLSGMAVAEASERLRFFAGTTDGFALAEKDLELRGPGELLGTRQHGLPDLRVADLLGDRAILADARRDAFRVIELDPGLKQPQNECIKGTLMTRYHGRSELLRVG